MTSSRVLAKDQSNNEGVKYYPKKSKRPLQAIRYFCFECMGWDRRYRDSGKPFEDVKQCPDEMCPLFDFRMGKNPFYNTKNFKGNLDALRKARGLVNGANKISENRISHGKAQKGIG